MGVALLIDESAYHVKWGLARYSTGRSGYQSAVRRLHQSLSLTERAKNDETPNNRR
jgi:hypothetical protein